MILKNTPSWVFVLFFALVALGYFLSRDRTVGRSRLVITPAAMMALSLYGVLSAFGIGPVCVPFRSPCHICMARNYRTRFADAAGFVQRTLNDPLPARAAFGPGVSVVAGQIASTALQFITGTADRDVLTTSFRTATKGAVETISYVRYRDCPVCGGNE